MVYRITKKKRVYLLTQTIGGGSVGLMGTVAKAVLDNGGQAIAVVPEPLYRHGSKQICEAVIVPDMHTRKQRMADEVTWAIEHKDAVTDDQ